jgi:transposase InsO family protein
MGLYEWTRCPMGLKGAPSYFQGVLAKEVLVGLLHEICELYIDDIIVHGNTVDEFCKNVEEVFKRLKKHLLVANPKKLVLGLMEVEFVGHILNETGVTFSRERIDKVLAIKEPVYAKELKTFLGVVGYFHTHIRDYATISKPLHRMLVSYNRSKKLIWSDESRKAFESLKKAVNECPTLFFLSDDGEIFLHTDASDYGLGGYCFQIINGIEKPVAFVSKMLSDSEIRWTTTEKEAYAIVYCLKKLEYLLRDRTFTLRTDHKNLIYVDAESSAKVKRWKLVVQEYDFFIEHIAGKLNTVADGFSRLLQLEEEHLYLHDEFSLTREEHNHIETAHNEWVGHHGVERTLQKLISQGKRWKYMREHVKRFIRRCPCCQKMSFLSTPIHTHPFTTACYEPMERWAIDTLGPLPDDEDGNKYVLVIICCFTRWVSLYPIKDTSALSCVDALMHLIGTFGTPSQILTDNGSQFVNDVVAELLKIIGVPHLTILAYSKEENAIVERANKEVLRHLRALVFSHNETVKWSKHYLPLVQRIINTTKVDSHNSVPADLMFGKAITLDRNVLLLITAISDERKALSNWAANMLSKQQDLIDVAEKTQRLRDQQQIAQADPRRTIYGTDDYVLVEYQPSSLVPRGRPPSKLLPNLRGPLRVVNRDGDAYTLVSLVDGKEETIHVSRLHPFHYDPVFTSPRDAALRDVHRLFDVEEILDHEPKSRVVDMTRSEIDFHVKFLNWGPEYNLWLPYSELRNIPALHRYLAVNRMKTLIPPEFKAQYR